jgi:glycosyltransferase involved in cell wall biosynthesis
LEYSPYAFARWGFAPYLLIRFRRRRARKFRLALFVHEPFDNAPEQPLRKRLITVWQRYQLRKLVGGSDLIFVANDGYRDVLQALVPGCEVTHVPTFACVGTEGIMKEEARARLGLADGALILSTFGGSRPDRGLEHIAHAVQAIRQIDSGVILLNLGEDAPPEIPGLSHADVRRPGALSEEDLSAWLASSDLLLAPFRGGACSRRSTIAAALSHGLPVLATRGRMTDALLTEHPEALCLVDAESTADFALEAALLVQDDERRVQLAEAGLAFYEAELSPENAARTVAISLGICSVENSSEPSARVDGLGPR